MTEEDVNLIIEMAEDGMKDSIDHLQKELVKIIDLSGRESPPIPNRLLLYLFNDGSVEKRIVVE